jgi:hypothetical protein
METNPKVVSAPSQHTITMPARSTSWVGDGGALTVTSSSPWPCRRGRACVVAMHDGHGVSHVWLRCTVAVGVGTG